MTANGYLLRVAEVFWNQIMVTVTQFNEYIKNYEFKIEYFIASKLYLNKKCLKKSRIEVTKTNDTNVS